VVRFLNNEQYSRKVQTQFQIDEALLRDAACFVHASTVESVRQIANDEINIVYEIRYTDGRHLIARISRCGGEDLARELWAIKRCAEAGVLVPDVVSVWQLKDQEAHVTVCFEERMLGVPLQGGEVDYRYLDANVWRSLVAQAGEVLARIHAIPTNGFGILNGQGNGVFNTLKETLADEIDGAKSITL
jgi:Ser/Thr protein kinase RdoA (MazF antagonist)